MHLIKQDLGGGGLGGYMHTGKPQASKLVGRRSNGVGCMKAG